MGPHNNIFNSILFVIPSIIFTNLFRLLLLGIYRMKRFSTPTRLNLWLKGISTMKEWTDC